jgi:hypothetical protein
MLSVRDVKCRPEKVSLQEAVGEEYGRNISEKVSIEELYPSVYKK